MASKAQLTRMRGVYLVAAELARHGFVASPPSRGASAADLLVTGEKAKHEFSVHVKTRFGRSQYWLISRKAVQLAPPWCVYVLVDLGERSGEGDGQVQYFVVPSAVVKEHCDKRSTAEWYWFPCRHAEQYRDKWDFFRDSSRHDEGVIDPHPTNHAHQR